MAGETLAGADFAGYYLRGQDEARRARESDSIANYRQQEAEYLRSQREATQAVSNPENVQGLINQPGSDQTLAPGTPGSSAEVQGPSAPQGPPSPVGIQQPQSPADMGGKAEDLQPEQEQPAAAAPQPTSAGGLQPGQKVQTPGRPAVTQKLKTYEDAVKAIGATEVGKLLATQAGREQLRSLGYISPAELEQRRNMATSDQEGRGFQSDIMEAAESGDMRRYLNLRGAQAERKAEVQSDPALKQHYEAESRGYYDKAVALGQDKELEKQAGPIMSNLMRAKDAWLKDGSNQHYDQMIQALEAARQNKATAGEAEKLYAQIFTVSGKLLGDPQYASRMQRQQFLGEKMRDNPGMRPMEALKAVLKEHPDIYAATMEEGLNSKNPDEVQAYGGAPTSIVDHPGSFAAFLAAGDGLHPGDPKWGQAVLGYYKQIYQAQSKANLSNMFGQRVLGDKRILQSQLTLAEKDLKDIGTFKGTDSDEYHAKQRDIEDLNMKIQNADGQLINLGIHPNDLDAGGNVVSVPPRGSNQPTTPARPGKDQPGGVNGPSRPQAVYKTKLGLMNAPNRAAAKKYLDSLLKTGKINSAEYNEVLKSQAYTGIK